MLVVAFIAAGAPLRVGDESLWVEWTSHTPSNTARTEGAGAVYDGKLYVVAGFARDVLVTHVSEVYDPASDTWTQLAPIPRAVTHVGAALVDGRIWIVGGFEGNHPGPAVDIVQIYDIATDSWSGGPPLPSPRASGTLALLGRRLHYIGGLLPDRQTDVGEHLVLDVDDWEAGWTAAAPLPRPRNHLSSVVFEGRLYVIGGQFGHDGGRTLTSLVHTYDYASDKWSRLADLPQRLSHAEASTFVHNARFVVAGGVGPGPNRTASLDQITAYNPTSNSWTEFGVLPEKLLGLEARVIGERLFAANGSVGLSTNAKSTVWSIPVPPAEPDTLGFWPRSLRFHEPQADRTNVLLWTHHGNTPFMINTVGLPSWLELERGRSEVATPEGSPLYIAINTSGLESGTYTTVVTVSAPGYPDASLEVSLVVPLSTAIDHPVTMEGFALGSNYPNPFSAQTRIVYTMAHQARATISIYDLLGKPVETLVNRDLSAGSHEVFFDATGLATGLYMYELRAGDFHQTRFMVVAR